jgi:phage FluMu gp28-like protein
MKQSSEVKLKAKNGLIRLGEDLVQDSADTLGLDNGSRIISLPGSPKSVRGWSAGLLIIDEAAFLDPETFLAARATVAATGGRTIVQSTPISPFGHFYDLFSTPDAGWTKYQVSSEEVSTIAPSFLASEKAKLTDDEYAQEYLGQFASAGLGLVDPERLKELTLKDPTQQSVWDKMRS